MPFCRWWLTGHPARGATTHLRLARGWRWRFWPPPGCALARAASLPYCDPASNHTAITQNTHRALVVPAVCRVVCRVPVRASCALPPAWGAGARNARGMGNGTRTTKERQVRGARERTALGLHPHAARALGARSRRVHCGVRGPGRPLRCRLAASFRPSHHAHCSLAPPRTGEGSHHERQTRTRTRREARRADTPRATTRVT